MHICVHTYFYIKVDSERQIFMQLFMIVLFTRKVFARNLLRGSRRRYILAYFILSQLGLGPGRQWQL